MRKGHSRRKNRKRYAAPLVYSGCSKKVAHRTKARAQVHVDRILAERVYVGGVGAPEVYRCRRCGYWHVGSLKRRG